MVNITKVTSSGVPRLHREEGDTIPMSDARTYKSEDGEDEWWEWWEGTDRLLRESPDPKKLWDTLSIANLSEEYVGSYRAGRVWDRKYLQGDDGPTGSPVLDALIAANAWAKTNYPSLVGPYLYYTYSIKWYYPERRLRFSADLGRVFRVAKAHNVEMRLMR